MPEEIKTVGDAWKVFDIAGLKKPSANNNVLFKDAKTLKKLLDDRNDLLEACKKAKQFIENGIDSGYIRLPDPPDPALATLPQIYAAIAKTEVKGE